MVATCVLLRKVPCSGEDGAHGGGMRQRCRANDREKATTHRIVWSAQTDLREVHLGVLIVFPTCLVMSAFCFELLYQWSPFRL